jgi:hypothetical protein
MSRSPIAILTALVAGAVPLGQALAEPGQCAVPGTQIMTDRGAIVTALPSPQGQPWRCVASWVGENFNGKVDTVLYVTRMLAVANAGDPAAQAAIERAIPQLIAGARTQVRFTEFPVQAGASPYVHSITRQADGAIEIGGARRDVVVIRHHVERLDQPLPAWDMTISLDRQSGFPLKVASDMQQPGNESAVSVAGLMPIVNWSATSIALAEAAAPAATVASTTQQAFATRQGARAQR